MDRDDLVTHRKVDVDRCEALIVRAAVGDGEACRLLIEHLWPILTGWVRSSRSMGKFSRAEDDVRDVVTRLAEKIGGRSAKALRLFAPWRQTNPEKTFEDWLRIMTANVIRDYIRERLGPRSISDGGPSPKRLLNEFASSAQIEEQGVRPPFTAAETARQLLDFAQARLPPEQLSALRLWLQGATHDEIGQELGLESVEAHRLLRAGVAVLRRTFAPAIEHRGGEK